MGTFDKLAQKRHEKVKDQVMKGDGGAAAFSEATLA